MNNKRGKDHPNWKGNNIHINSLHDFVNRNYKWIRKCELCGTEKETVLASKTYKYTRNKEDWWILCIRCNPRYDRKHGWGKGAEYQKCYKEQKAKEKMIQSYLDNGGKLEDLL